MPRPADRKLRLADLMVLVAMSGVGLSCYILIDNGLSNGQRFLYGLFELPTARWDRSVVLARAIGVLALMLIMFGGWTLALPLMRLCWTRAERRRSNRLAGTSACIAAIAGMTIYAGVVTCGLLIQWATESGSPTILNQWDELFDCFIIFTGISVAAVWITQVLTGLWRSSTGWSDRLGRFLGCVWIAAGLVASIRVFSS